jgi:hypothetical protein
MPYQKLGFIDGGSLTAESLNHMESGIEEAMRKAENGGGGTGGGGAGYTFVPSVSADGVISWTNDGGLDNPAPVDLTAAVLAALPTWNGGVY